MQRGIKQASDAYARVAASVGSLERIVELHDRGVFRDAAHTLGVEEVPVVDDDDNDAAAAQTVAAGALSDEGLLRPLLQKRQAGPNLPWWKRLLNRKTRQVEVRVLPPEVRPDFSSMLGGVRLEGVHLTLRSKTDRLVLSDASLEVAAGHAAIITGAAGGGKSSLLQLILLRHIPYKGYIAFQLPTSALPPSVSSSAAAAAVPSTPHLEQQQAAAPQGHTAAQTDNNVTQASTHQAPASPGSHAAAAAAATAADYDCSRGPAASLAYGTAPGGEGWLWAQFSFLKDDQKAARAAMAMVSVTTAVLFRTSVEDNVACAAGDVVVSADVRAVCQRVGAHDTIMTLPDGYRTLVGEGSGTIVSWALMLQLALARALIRRPKLLLLDDADQFAAVVGRRRLVGILQELQEQRGMTIVMAAADPGVFVSRGLAAAVYRLQDGQLYTL